MTVLRVRGNAPLDDIPSSEYRPRSNRIFRIVDDMAFPKDMEYFCDEIVQVCNLKEDE